MDNKVNETDARIFFSYGIDIGRELGKIDALLTDIRATVICNQELVSLLGTLRRRTVKLLKEVEHLYYHVA